jgi:hypothetical protein
MMKILECLGDKVEGMEIGQQHLKRQSEAMEAGQQRLHHQVEAAATSARKAEENDPFWHGRWKKPGRRCHVFAWSGWQRRWKVWKLSLRGKCVTKGGLRVVIGSMVSGSIVWMISREEVESVVSNEVEIWGTG